MMLATAIKGTLIGSASAASALAVTDPVTMGSQLGKMAASGILGVVCVVCVVALVKIYHVQLDNEEKSRKDRDEHIHRLYKLIEESTKAAQTTADAVRENAGVLVEVKNAMLLCQAKFRQFRQEG